MVKFYFYTLLPLILASTAKAGEEGESKEPEQLPTYRDLPCNGRGHEKACWMWGEEDELGTLNFLTPERVKEAASEIQLGERFSLNWEINKPDPPALGRKKFEHKLINKAPRSVFDDEIHINTQSSSQFDGYAHFGHQESGLFYNNVTSEDVEGGKILGMAAYNQAGGISGRGVLLDVYDWYERKGEAYDPMTSFGVPVDVLKQVAEEQGVTFKTGDILFVRFGFTQAQDNAPEEVRVEWSEQDPPHAAGLLQSEEAEAFIFDNHFAAIAGDTLAFEVYPTTTPPYMMHEAFLGGWGCPIGEMLYLDKLAKRCKELGRYTFFVSGTPLNVPQGVGSPPNTVAIL